MELVYITDKVTGIKYYIKSMISNSHTVDTTLTSYPTTEGTSISDHAYRNPITLTLNIATSEYNRFNDNIFYYKNENLENQEQINLDLVSVKNLIDTWQKESTRLLIQTRLKQYDNMVISSVSLTENNENKGVYDPTITFKECRIANIYTEVLGPFETEEVKPNYTTEYNMGSSNGASWEGTLGGIAAGAAIGGVAFGPWGAVIGGAIGAFGNWVGWW